jgi:ergosteryl-3beta-O-L-aspartate synthase
MAEILKALLKFRKTLRPPASRRASDDDTCDSKAQKAARRKECVEEKKQIQHLKEEEAICLRRKTSDDEASLIEPKDLRERYGEAHGHNFDTELIGLNEISSSKPGTLVSFRARIHHIRKMGSDLAFSSFNSELIPYKASWSNVKGV